MISAFLLNKPWYVRAAVIIGLIILLEVVWDTGPGSSCDKII